MKTILLGTGVAIVVLVAVILFIITRGPEPPAVGQVDTRPVDKPAAAALCEGLPEAERQRCLEKVPTDGAPAAVMGSGSSARAERGSGIEGVTSGGVNVAPGGTQRELKP